eukprot:6494262-Pyramimonas_sp.AAC.3
MTDAVVDLGPVPPASIGKLDYLEYYTGKFPTQVQLDISVPNKWSSIPLSNLQPGTEYEVSIFAAAPQYSRCPSLKFRTKQSSGHKCEMFVDSDFEGHDAFYGYDSRFIRAKNAKECCNLCAAIKPRLPYYDTCRHWVYEDSTQKCWFKARDAMQGKKARDGFTAGRVTLE